MSTSYTLLGSFIPKNAAEVFGTAAFSLHVLGYIIYARHVLSEKIRPNAATWFMWLFGGIVELVTYDAITGSHWSTTALPFACVIGVGIIGISITIAQLRNKGRVVYHKPTRSDYYLVAFDMLAGALWLLGFSPVLANMIAVSTSITTFIPLWRTTYNEPKSEDPIPWMIWCAAYTMMTLAIMMGNGSGEIGLYFYPLYYFALHFTVIILITRKGG